MRHVALTAAVFLAAALPAIAVVPPPPVPVPPPAPVPPVAPAPPIPPAETPTEPEQQTSGQFPEGTPPPAGSILIAIDPGHGGADSGAVGVLPSGTPTGLRARSDGKGRTLLLEKDVNLDVSRRLQRWLERQGYRTLMTRTRDLAGGDRSHASVRDDLQARVDIANQAGANLFVSIHMNAARSKEARGSETFHFTIAGPAAQGLAGSIQDRLITRTGLPSRGVKKAGFYVLKHTVMPAALVEGGFLSNARDAGLIATPVFRARVAAGVGEGVKQYIDEGGRFDDPVAEPAPVRFWVHAGQFRKRAEVSKRVTLLRSRGFDAVIARRFSARANRVMFFAVAGQFAFIENATRLRTELRGKGLPATIGPAA